VQGEPQASPVVDALKADGYGVIFDVTPMPEDADEFQITSTQRRRPHVQRAADGVCRGASRAGLAALRAAQQPRRRRA